MDISESHQTLAYGRTVYEPDNRGGDGHMVPKSGRMPCQASAHFPGQLMNCFDYDG